MAEWSNSGWTGGFVSSYTRGSITPTTPSVPETAQPVQDSPGVVSAYTRGSIVPKDGPEHTQPEFNQNGGQTEAVAPSVAPFKPDSPRQPAPRLEMPGPIGRAVHDGVRQVQRTDRMAAMDKAYGVNAVNRMKAMRPPRRAVELGEDFRQSTPKPKRHI